jgi:hypothetical protein
MRWPVSPDRSSDPCRRCSSSTLPAAGAARPGSPWLAIRANQRNQTYRCACPLPNCRRFFWAGGAAGDRIAPSPAAAANQRNQTCRSASAAAARRGGDGSFRERERARPMRSVPKKCPVKGRVLPRRETYHSRREQAKQHIGLLPPAGSLLLLPAAAPAGERPPTFDSVRSPLAGPSRLSSARPRLRNPPVG